MYRAKEVDGQGEIEGGYCEIEERHFIIPDGASVCYRVKIISLHDFIEGFIEIDPDTLEIKIGDNWFSPEYVESIFKKLGEFGLKRLMKE